MSLVEKIPSLKFHVPHYILLYKRGNIIYILKYKKMIVSLNQVVYTNSGCYIGYYITSTLAG